MPPKKKRGKAKKAEEKTGPSPEDELKMSFLVTHIQAVFRSHLFRRKYLKGLLSLRWVPAGAFKEKIHAAFELYSNMYQSRFQKSQHSAVAAKPKMTLKCFLLFCRDGKLLGQCVTIARVRTIFHRVIYLYSRVHDQLDNNRLTFSYFLEAIYRIVLIHAPALKNCRESEVGMYVSVNVLPHATGGSRSLLRVKEMVEDEGIDAVDTFRVPMLKIFGMYSRPMRVEREKVAAGGHHKKEWGLDQATHYKLLDVASMERFLVDIKIMPRFLSSSTLAAVFEDSHVLTTYAGDRVALSFAEFQECLYRVSRGMEMQSGEKQDLIAQNCRRIIQSRNISEILTLLFDLLELYFEDVFNMRIKDKLSPTAIELDELEIESLFAKPIKAFGMQRFLSKRFQAQDLQDGAEASEEDGDEGPEEVLFDWRSENVIQTVFQLFAGESSTLMGYHAFGLCVFRFQLVEDFGVASEVFVTHAGSVTRFLSVKLFVRAMAEVADIKYAQYPSMALRRRQLITRLQGMLPTTAAYVKSLEGVGNMATNDLNRKEKEYMNLLHTKAVFRNYTKETEVIRKSAVRHTMMDVYQGPLQVARLENNSGRIISVDSISKNDAPEHCYMGVQMYDPVCQRVLLDHVNACNSYGEVVRRLVIAGFDLAVAQSRASRTPFGRCWRVVEASTRDLVGAIWDYEGTFSTIEFNINAPETESQHLTMTVYKDVSESQLCLLLRLFQRATSWEWLRDGLRKSDMILVPVLFDPGFI